MNRLQRQLPALGLLLLTACMAAQSAYAHSPAGGHTTVTALVCSPGELGVNLPSTCTVTVTDVVGNGQDAVPVGTVSFSSSTTGSFSASSCTLVSAGGFAASCSVTYTPTVVAAHTITATYPATTNASHRWAGSSGSTTVTARARPTVAKSFSPSAVGTLVSSTLTITLSNSNAAAITGVAFTDSYPANLVNAAAPSASTTCGGSLTAVAGGTSVSLSGGTIPAVGSCTVSISVTSSVAGSYANDIPVGAVTSINAGSNTAASASATLAVLDRPGVSKAFSPASIPGGGGSTLTITLSNTNVVAITGVAFTDTYPAGLLNFSTASTSCGGVALAVVGGGTVSLSGGAIPAGGSCTVTVSVTAAVAGSYPNGIPVGGVTSANAGWNTLAASATLTVVAVVTAFDAVESGAAPLTNLYTKLAGVSFSVDILALDAMGAVSAGYTGTVALALVDAATGGGVCASMTSMQSLGNLVFAAPDAGRKAVSISYPGALRSARIRITDAALGIVSCSFDAFTIRPTTFTVSSSMTNSTTSGTPTARAGDNFTLTATAVSGYDGTPTIDGSRLAAHAGAIQTGSLAGTFAPANPATGAAQGTSFTYGEVGNFQFLSRGVLDETFTAVDQPGDCSNDFSNTLIGGRYGCKFGNTAATSNFGRFTPEHFMLSAATLTNRNGAGCAPASMFTYMDEPIGIAFTLTARNSAGVTTQNYTSASGFAKLDTALPASFSFAARDGGVATMRSAAITAITKANPGQVTTTAAHNYVSGDRVTFTRVSGMSEINGMTVTVTVLDATRFTIGLDTSGAGFSAYASGGMTSRLLGLTSGGTWVGGAADIQATAMLARSAAPDGPFASLTLAMAPRDGDGVALSAAMLNFDADGDSGNDSAGIGSTVVQFGRLRLGNAFGSARLALPLPLTAEYHDGNSFVINTLDNCTTLVASDIRFDFLPGTPKLVACETGLDPTGSIVFISGRAAARLTAPGGGNDGAVDLTVNLVGASGNTCTSGVSSVATSAAKSYLQGNWGGGTYAENPRARFTFGIYKNASEFIYFRENF